MLKTDPASGPGFCGPGILDGYLLLEDRILLFDYKTDRYRNPSGNAGSLPSPTGTLRRSPPSLLWCERMNPI